jgi:hypothetical protein
MDAARLEKREAWSAPPIGKSLQAQQDKQVVTHTLRNMH